MAGTTGLEPAACAVTGGIRRLGVRLSATVGFIGQRRLVLVQRFVQALSPCRARAKTKSEMNKYGCHRRTQENGVQTGICQEAIYRGYLQRQFMPVTKNVPAGIVLSAVAFGLAHLYQGVPQGCRLRCWESWAGSWRTGTRAFGPE